MSQGIPADEIAVLYPRDDRRRFDALCRELRRNHDVCWIANDDDPTGGVRSLSRPGVRLSTIRKAKGLEFQAVIVAAVDQLPGDDEIVDANLLDVGLTLATDHLAVTWTGRSTFTDRIAGSKRAVARVHQLHSSLLSGRTGQVIVSLVTLGSLLLVLSGLVLWWRERAWRVRWSASWKRVVYDLHHALGVLSALFLLVIMATGVWIGFASQINPLILALDRTPQPARAPVQPPPTAGAVPISLDSIASSANSVAPDAPIVLIVLPPRGAAQVALRYAEDHTPGGRSRAVIDRYRGTVLWSSITRTAGTGTRLINLQRAVHTGDIFGPLSQAVWFLVSIILASQAVTGVLMWWNGRAGRRARAAPR